MFEIAITIAGVLLVLLIYFIFARPKKRPDQLNFDFDTKKSEEGKRRF